MAIANSTASLFPAKFHRNTFLLRSGGTIPPRFLRFVARMAVWSERCTAGNFLDVATVRIVGVLLDKASGSPLIRAKVRDELKRLLRSAKLCPPGWRKACFHAAERRFGSLKG